ncbi:MULTISPECIES: hypothetical protein [unclassified Blastococcus]
MTRVAPEPWTPGIEPATPRPGQPGAADAPQGRLHAVAADGLVTGMALCMTPVLLLDPAYWAWPDDGSSAWPLCWTCLALTC